MGWLYETRGCTLFPDRGLHPCCLEHDDAYRAQTTSRLRADTRLLICGAQAGYPWRALLAFALVRAAGWIRWEWIRRKKGGARAA